jgi:acyl-CoA synthetase (AMP-forming)/AMP-acid ligase II
MSSSRRSEGQEAATLYEVLREPPERDFGLRGSPDQAGSETFGLDSLRHLATSVAEFLRARFQIRPGNTVCSITAITVRRLLHQVWLLTAHNTLLELVCGTFLSAARVFSCCFSVYCYLQPEAAVCFLAVAYARGVAAPVSPSLREVRLEVFCMLIWTQSEPFMDEG